MDQHSILFLLLNADPVVQGVLLLLAVMSLSSWAIVIAKLVGLSGMQAKVRMDVANFSGARNLRSAVKKVGRDTKSPTSRVCHHGVKELGKLDEARVDPVEQLPIVMDNLERALGSGVAQASAKLSENLSFLATCSNAAPFIGLFGTVWGIMHSFRAIGMMKTATLAVVAPGISEALIATAIGLAVAIPATIFYNYFLGKVAAIEGELTAFSAAFLNRVQRELPNRQPASAGPGEDEE